MSDLEWPQFGVSDNERRLTRMYEKRIIALEAALKMLLEESYGLHQRLSPNEDSNPTPGQDMARQALTSSEGAGEFPQTEECDFCDGRGYILRDEEDFVGQPCEACEGSGKAPTHSPTSAAGNDR